MVDDSNQSGRLLRVWVNFHYLSMTKLTSDETVNSSMWVELGWETSNLILNLTWKGQKAVTWTCPENGKLKKTI